MLQNLCQEIYKVLAFLITDPTHYVEMLMSPYRSEDQNASKEKVPSIKDPLGPGELFNMVMIHMMPYDYHDNM